MNRDNGGVQTTIIVTVLFLTTTTAHAVFAQVEGHSSMEVDFGLLESDGSCNVASDEYTYGGDGSFQACLLVEYQTVSNARFNLSIWSSSYSDTDLDKVELIVTPGTREVFTVALNLIIPSDMGYGESRLLARIDDWSPQSGAISEPIVNADSHDLVIQRSDTGTDGSFSFDGQDIQVSRFAELRGVMTHYNNGGISFSVRPVLLQSSTVISSSSSYSIRSEASTDRRVAFQLPDSLNTGTHTLRVALQDIRDSSYLWMEEIEVTILDYSGLVDTSFAHWDIPSFDGPSALGTYPGDVVQIQLNQTNPGSLSAVSDVWVGFVSGTDCFPVYLGEVRLEAGETRTSTHSVTIPEVVDGTALEASLMESPDCSAGPLQTLEQIFVFDWPISLTAMVHVDDSPSELDGENAVSISFSATNLESRPTTGLEASVTLFALGHPLGQWVGPLTLGANQTHDFQIEVDSLYCYDGSVDASLKIWNSQGELVHSSMTQNSLSTYFIEGEFDIQSTLVGDGIVSLGMPIQVQTHIHALASNPSGCTLLVPIMSVFTPLEDGNPPITVTDIIEIESGESLWHNLDTSVSSLSGTYQISQHLIRNYVNGTSDNWMASAMRFAELEVTPTSPEFITDCNPPVNLREGRNYVLQITCEIESRTPAPAWVMIGTEIGGSVEWEVPVKIAPNDRETIELSRRYSLGIDSSADLLARVLWDGEWIEVMDPPIIFPMQVNDGLDGSDPFRYETVTSHPTFPRGGEPFAIQFWAVGSSAWAGGSYEVRLWLDSSKEGAAYLAPPQAHNLEIGVPDLIEVGFSEWPDTCGWLPYEIVARDSEGRVLDTIESGFDGCTIELIDLSLVGHIEISQSMSSCVATITVENTGTRDYEPKKADEQADVTLIVDGIVTKSSVTVPPLDIGERTSLEVGIPTSGFQDLRIVLDGERRYSELDRSDNGLGWSSTSGPIIFENDSDFDGLSNQFEKSGYDITTLETRAVLENLIDYLVDPANHTAPNLNSRPVLPDQSRHDTDLDGLSDYLEWTIGSDPTSDDTDGDGYLDFEEYRSTSNDPLMMEMELPVIHSSEPVQTQHPVESELKSGLFKRVHTRSFYVEDRNFVMATVTVVKPGSSQTIEPIWLGEEGGEHHYSVTYEYSPFEEFSVTVTAYDEFGNEAVLEIASQDSVWERVTNKINSFATGALLEKLGPVGPVVLGYLTGLVYGLKDIVDIVTGIIPFLQYLWENKGELIGAALDILYECAPQPQFPIRIPGDCPILNLNVSAIYGNLKKEFLGLSPYVKESASTGIFLIFTVVGFLHIAFISGSLLAKGFQSARTMSGAVDDISSGIGKTKVAATASMNAALTRTGSGLKSGVQGSILSKFPAVPEGIGASVNSALTAVMVVKARKVAVSEIGDAYKLIKKAKSSPGAYTELMDNPHGFSIIKYKHKAIGQRGAGSWARTLDDWLKDDMALLKQLQSGDPKKIGYARERLHKSITGESGLTMVVNGKKTQLDTIWSKRNPDGSREWGSRELKQSRDPLGLARTDTYDKAIPLSRTARDLNNLEGFCPPGMSYTQCYDKFVDAGVDSITADDFAGCLTKRYSCGDFKTTPDFNDLDSIMKGVGCMDRPGKCMDMADGEWGKEIQKAFRECADDAATYGSVCSGMPSREALDAACPGNNLNCLKEAFPAKAEDLRKHYREEWIEYIDSSTDMIGEVMNPLLDEVNGIPVYTAQSLFFFPVEESKVVPWWAPLIAIFVILSYILNRKLRPKLPVTQRLRAEAL